MTPDSATTGQPLRVVVIGGGYSAATFAVQLLDATSVATGDSEASAKPGPIQLTIVEPRDALGQGRAYSSADPDHRINAPSLNHMAFTAGIDHFHQWFITGGGLDRDPEAAFNGAVFPRRAEFGRYLGELLNEALGQRRVVHLRDHAIGVGNDQHGLTVTTARGQTLSADRLIVATGNTDPGTPSFVADQLSDDQRFLASPWVPERIAALPVDARVLILGSGLTAADVIASLARNGHRGPVHVVSRRGLRPQPLPATGMTPALSLWHRLELPIPEFLASDDPQTPLTLRHLLRRLRRRIAGRGDGRDWYEPFDELRDALWRIWPVLSTTDQRRYQRHLKPWYDSYRYRLPPQTSQRIEAALAAGWLRFEAGRVLSVRAAAGDALVVRRMPRGQTTIVEQTFDRVINCTGPQNAARGSNRFLDALLDAGLAAGHPSGAGLRVDASLCAIDAAGRSDPRIRVIGPPSAGSHADAIGAAFICAHVARMMPGFAAGLFEARQPSAAVD